MPHRFFKRSPRSPRKPSSAPSQANEANGPEAADRSGAPQVQRSSRPEAGIGAAEPLPPEAKYPLDLEDARGPEGKFNGNLSSDRRKDSTATSVSGTDVNGSTARSPKNSVRVPLVPKDTPRTPDPEYVEDITTAWRRFYCCVGCSLAFLFLASVVTGMEVAAVMLDTSEATTTSTTFRMAMLAHDEAWSADQLMVASSGTTTTTSTTVRTTTTCTTTGTTGTRTTVTSTTTSTRATTTTVTTLTTTRTHTGIDFLPSLFCFCASKDDGEDIEILRVQLAQGRGIFGCNDWEVFTNTEVWLSPGTIKTVAVQAENPVWSPQKDHPEWARLLNVGMFMKIWDAIHSKSLATLDEWTVKVDADTFFIPRRLRQYMRSHNRVSTSKTYFLNCKKWKALKGSLEVISRPAAEIFARDRQRCLEVLDWESLGEDQFMQGCFSYLEIDGVPGWDMLKDAQCVGPPVDCSGRETVAFHSFKTLADQWTCSQAVRQETSAGLSLPGLSK